MYDRDIFKSKSKRLVIKLYSYQRGIVFLYEEYNGTIN